MERATENIYEWTGHRELTEKDRKYLAELKKDLFNLSNMEEKESYEYLYMLVKFKSNL